MSSILSLFPFFSPTCQNPLHSLYQTVSIFSSLLLLSMLAAVDCGSVIMGPEEECLFAILPTLCAVCLLADTADFDPQ